MSCEILHHPPAIESIGGVPRNENQHRHRNELRQPDEPKVERAVGQLIDLPADRHRADLIAELGNAACREEEQERRVAEQISGGAGQCGGH
jgi:hypothetical protein